MSQSIVKVGRAVLWLKKTSNLVENGPKFTVLAVPKPKILFACQPWSPTIFADSKAAPKN